LNDAVWQLFLVALSQNFLPQTGKYLGGAKSRLSPLAALLHSATKTFTACTEDFIFFSDVRQSYICAIARCLQ
jgi:hypothetical protein